MSFVPINNGDSGLVARTLLNSSLSSTQPIVSVWDFGAKGDNSTDDTAAIQAAIDFCFGPASNPNGVNSELNKVLFFPPGTYRVLKTLNLTQVQGGRIIGSGREISRIYKVPNATIGGDSVFKTNGFSFGRVEGIGLTGCFQGTLFKLDWDGINNVSLQSNSFVDCFFDGGTHGSNYGVRIGTSGAMGSENLFLNCFVSGCVIAGLTTENSNALQQTIVGGNFQSNTIGVNVEAGSVTGIYSTGFQQNTSWDIQMTADASNCIAISGCRSESTNFLNLGVYATVDSCLHTGTGFNGDFLKCDNGTVHIRGCKSNLGRMNLLSGARVGIYNSEFNRSDWMSATGLWSMGAGNPDDAVIDIVAVTHGDGAGHFPTIIKQRIYADTLNNTKTRTLDIYAAALTDWNVAGQTFDVGDQILQSAPVAGGSPGWVCTTAGVAGVGAVFKAMANVAA